MLCVRRPEAGEADRQHVGEDRLELLGDGAVDEEVGGEVDHDQQVRHALQTHNPHGRDVLVKHLHAGHLHVCNKKRKSIVNEFNEYNEIKN